MGALERWYQRIDASEVVELALPKFTEQAGAARRIRGRLPNSQGGG